MWVGSLGQEDPLEEGPVTLSGILARRTHGQGSLKGYGPVDHAHAHNNKFSGQPSYSSFLLYFVGITDRI